MALVVGALYKSCTFRSNREFGPFRYVGYDDVTGFQIFKTSKPRNLIPQVQEIAERMGLKPSYVWRVGLNDANDFELVFVPYDPDQEPEEDCL